MGNLAVYTPVEPPSTCIYIIDYPRGITQKNITIDYMYEWVYDWDMPQVNVYIRDEDYLKWTAIEKKSEWMHEALSGTSMPVNPPDTKKPKDIPPEEEDWRE